MDVPLENCQFLGSSRIWERKGSDALVGLKMDTTENEPGALRKRQGKAESSWGSRALTLWKLQASFQPTFDLEQLRVIASRAPAFLGLKIKSC